MSEAIRSVIESVDSLDATVDENEGSILGECLVGDYKLSMWIPGDSAGRVVGKKGVVITNLQTETKSKQINALSAVGDSLWVAVVIIGDWKSINAAYHAVSDIVNHEVDDVVLEFSINARKPSFLLGKNRLYLVKIVSAKTAVRIFLPDLGSKEHEKLSSMTLEGSFDDVRRAVNLLEAEAKSFKDRCNDRKAHPKSLLERDASMAGNNKTPNDCFRKEELKVQDCDHEISEYKENRFDDRQNDVAKPNASSSSESKIKGEECDLKADIPPPKIMDSPAISISKRMDVQKVIHIPASIVGLLLSKRPPLKATVMNQIQNTTNTIISKIVVDSRSDEVIVKRKESTETIETFISETKSNVLQEDDNATVSQEDDGSCDDITVDSTAFQDTVEVPDNLIDTSAVNNEKRKSSEFVPFRILGFTSENVEAAFSHLDRIVGGERIKDVMESLKIVAKSLPRRESGVKPQSKDVKDRDRKSLLEKKSSKEKRSRKIMDKLPVSEKSSEREGVWRKEKLTEKDIVSDNITNDKPKRFVASSQRTEVRSRGSSASVNKEAELKVSNIDHSGGGEHAKRSGKFIKKNMN